jgi:hypothetical protein
MSDTLLVVRRIVLFLVSSALLVGALWLGLTVTRWLAGRTVRVFQAEADGLFEAFHKYKEYVGHYPEGSNAEVVKALCGNNPQKVIILAVKKEHLNAKGEVVDPWGTPLKIYFAATEVLIRSAGPNRRFEDGKVRNGDDFFRSD